jgi:hypothetical protein
MDGILECTTTGPITWIYCPGHAGVRANEKAENLAGQAPIDGVLCMDRGYYLKWIIYKLKKAENEDKNNNVHIQRMRELGMREGEEKRSILKSVNSLLIPRQNVGPDWGFSHMQLINNTSMVWYGNIDTEQKNREQTWSVWNVEIQKKN